VRHIWNAYGFHRAYSAAARQCWERGREATEADYMKALGVSRSTLYRMRVTFALERGSSGLTDAELAALKIGENVTHR
jgi:hypothetical protein